MSSEFTLYFSGGYLRQLKPTDVFSGYVAGLNDPEVNKYLEVRHNKQTIESVTDFVSTNERSSTSCLFGIWPDNSSRFIGTVRIHGIDRLSKKGHIGICLFEKTAWRQGFGSKAIRSATRWAIESQGLRWIEAGAYESNIASQKMFLSSGYEWVSDITGKYLLNGKPATIKVFAAIV